MLLFSLTGITLNHAAQIKANTQIVTMEAGVPASIIAAIKIPSEEKAVLPAVLIDYQIAPELEQEKLKIIMAEYEAPSLPAHIGHRLAYRSYIFLAGYP